MSHLVVRKRSFALDHEESQGYPSSTSTWHDVKDPEMEGHKHPTGKGKMIFKNASFLTAKILMHSQSSTK